MPTKQQWNIACDVVINDLLRKHGIAPEQFNEYREQSAEAVYAALAAVTPLCNCALCENGVFCQRELERMRETVY